MFNNADTTPRNEQTGLNRNAVVAVDGLFYDYDVHDWTLHKYQLIYLVGDRQEKLKYLLRVGKVYCVNRQFQHE